MATCLKDSDVWYEALQPESRDKTFLQCTALFLCLKWNLCIQKGSAEEINAKTQIGMVIGLDIGNISEIFEQGKISTN